MDFPTERQEMTVTAAIRRQTASHFSGIASFGRVMRGSLTAKLRDVNRWDLSGASRLLKAFPRAGPQAGCPRDALWMRTLLSVLPENKRRRHGDGITANGADNDINRSRGDSMVERRFPLVFASRNVSKPQGHRAYRIAFLDTLAN